MVGHRLNPTIHRYEDVELIEVHSEYLECSFMVAKDEWESGKYLLTIFSPLDGNVLGFQHYCLHRDNISAAGPKLPDGTTAQPGMAEAIEIERQAGHTIYADHLAAMLYGTVYFRLPSWYTPDAFFSPCPDPFTTCELTPSSVGRFRG